MTPAARRKKSHKRAPRAGGIFAPFWRKHKWYVIAAILLGIAVRLFVTYKDGALVAADVVGGYDWVISIVVAAWYGHYAYTHAPDTKLSCLILDAGFMGVLFAIVMSLLDVAIIRSAWAITNILVKPILLFVIFAAVAVIGFFAHKNGYTKK
ncbi:MAG: hypothetical protein ACPGO5_03085 [Patescibacteria group bacterium]